MTWQPLYQGGSALSCVLWRISTSGGEETSSDTPGGAEQWPADKYDDSLTSTVSLSLHHRQAKYILLPSLTQRYHPNYKDSRQN